MRLYSLHPKYLDQKGLCGLWTESLLAQKVLMGQTRGYKNHPQLDRFKKYRKDIQINVIGQYLNEIWKEANRRKYNFDRDKIKNPVNVYLLNVTTGQLEYEFEHLCKKLFNRNREWLNKIHKLKNENIGRKFFFDNHKCLIEPHPLFKIIEGDIESWEKVK